MMCPMSWSGRSCRLGGVRPAILGQMTLGKARAFVRRHGIVLESARGAVPCLAETITGGRIRGSWWAHPRSHEIFELTRGVRQWEDVLVCRLIDGKVTYVHRRLWPAIVRLDDRLPRKRLSLVREIHTDSGRHVVREIPYPRWVPPAARRQAERWTEKKALSTLRRAGLTLR